MADAVVESVRNMFMLNELTFVDLNSVRVKVERPKSDASLTT